MTTATELGVLAAIESRVLWLAVAMIDHANRERPDPSGLKIGGHQASSASMVTIMTALWFHALRAHDRVSVKPHASPVLHAINYLLGSLDESYLTRLRGFGGLQSYPSRTKDPDQVDYSTGSVGIGATAPIWGALARRYIDGGVTGGRQYALLGDAELDEGACWEAVVDPIVGQLGEVVWVVDLNRQSLDRVVPHLAASRLAGMFESAGWQVLTVKYGHKLQALFERDGGPALRRRLDAMSNLEYQRLLRCPPDELRHRLAGSVPEIARLLSDVDDTELHETIGNLGGHDLGALIKAYDAIDDSRPTVIFAYTVKGYRLASAGHPQNHSRLLSATEMADLAKQLGIDQSAPWDRFPPGSAEGTWCDERARALRRPPVPATAPVKVPADLGWTPTGNGSTQQALGRTLLALTRQAPAAAARLVTVAPDVASSTNLGGWINKVGVWSPNERVDWFSDDRETILHWREGPAGQHIELGIAETNLVGLLGELGLTAERWGKPLLPVGVVYDPFVARALEPWAFSIYAGGRFVLVGTPSGVSLAAEGGAHQSVVTPSIGMELPQCVSYEPAFAIDAEWCLLAALSQLTQRDGESVYLRLSTRPIDQRLAAVPVDPAARERRRRQVVAGGYPLRRAAFPAVTIAAMGAVVPEALAAASRLSRVGVEADVVCLTSPDLVYRAVRARQGLDPAPVWILDQLFPADRARPLVTVLDGHPHTLSFLAAIHGTTHRALGVTRFGQSGDLASTYRHHGLDADAIVRAALDLTDAQG